MPQKWNSPDEIARYFHTEAEGSEVAALQNEIERQLRELHPDKSGGEFRTEQDKEQFHDLQEALTFLGQVSSSPTALIPGNEIATLLQTLVTETRLLASSRVVQQTESQVGGRESKTTFDEGSGGRF